MAKDRAKKKERQRLKRERKQAQLRKANSISPYKRAAAGMLISCHVNSDYRIRGQAAVFVARRNSQGGVAFAAFFIDLWCAGLKDAWGFLDATQSKFDGLVERSSESMDGTQAPVDLDEARQLVAGSIRFAVENGFRLPAGYQRWVAFLGDIGDWRQADVSYFGVEGGKLRWVAPLSDLRARLIGSTFEEFVARTDVEIVAVGDEDPIAAFGPGAQYEDELEEDEDFEEDDDEDDTPPTEAEIRLKEGFDTAVETVESWCESQNMKPSPLLYTALSHELVLHMLAGLERMATLGENSAALAELQRSRRDVYDAVAQMDHDKHLEYETAKLQLTQYANSTGNDLVRLLMPLALARQDERRKG